MEGITTKESADRGLELGVPVLVVNVRSHRLVEINRLSLLSSTRFVVDWLYIHIGSLSIVTA